MPKIRHYLSIILISLISAVLVSSPINQPLQILEAKIEVPFRQVGYIPLRNQTVAEPQLTAQSALVVDVESGSWLYEKQARQLLSPASTTKLMTVLVALDTYDLEQTLIVSPLISREGSNAALINGEELTVANLIEASLIQSANDAALTLAYNHPSEYEGFIQEMNFKAWQLGMYDTVFRNATGFDHPQHVSTARDLAILARAAMKNQFISEAVQKPSLVIADKTGNFQHWLKNTHQLVGVHPEVVGVKTGTTMAAGEVLITQFERSGHAILIVILGSQQRYPETIALADWIFSAYSWIQPHELINSVLMRREEPSP